MAWVCLVEIIEIEHQIRPVKVESKFAEVCVATNYGLEAGLGGSKNPLP